MVICVLIVAVRVVSCALLGSTSLRLVFMVVVRLGPLKDSFSVSIEQMQKWKSKNR